MINIMTMKTIFKFTLTALIAVVLTSCSETSVSSLSGAGATFPLPFYNAVFDTYLEEESVEVAYGGIGSGGGIRSLKDGVVDFAGSDAYLTDKEMSEMPAVVHVPSCMGAVVLAYNLPEVENLQLSGDVIADIFRGEIKYWNDSRIAALNPSVKLPEASIIPVFRSDGSGTTFVFTDYLTKVNSEWANKLGTGKSVNFPVGMAAKGNPGVANAVAQTLYSIGYVGSEYAFAQKIQYASIQNACGEMIKPSSASISAAAVGEMPTDTRVMITNSSSKGAYPISCFTWLLLYQEQNYAGRSIEQAQATLKMIKFLLSDRIQSMAEEVHYAPLPASAVELSLKNLENLTFNGEPILNK